MVMAASAPKRPMGRTGPWEVLIADDHPIVLHGVSRVIAEAPGFRVRGTAATAEECIELATRFQPDALVLDLRLGDALAPDICAAVRVRTPLTEIVIFTAFDGDALLLDACMSKGASTVLLKDAHQLDIVRALRQTLSGEAVRESGATRYVPVKRGDDVQRRLTAREHEVIRMFARGMTSKEIAESLHLAPNTVRSYGQSILRKLGSTNRVQALLEARRQRLL